jgi:fructose-1,6-bisphosphatase class II
MDLSLHFLKVVEAAAIACSRQIGRGERKLADRMAVEAMRAKLSTVPIRGRIVIGEGERDAAPMLYIGEEVGAGAANHPEIDIAVDPLEGTNLCALGRPNALAVLAAAPRGGLLHAPDIYMEKIVVGRTSKDAIDLDAPVAENLGRIAEALGRRVEDLLVVVLDRPRHEELIKDVRAAGARIRLISDGDVAPAIAAAMRGSGVHAVMGIGGAPEGVLTAAAIRCLNGGMRGRLVTIRPEDEDRMRRMGIDDPDRVYTEEGLAPAEEIFFAASGVTTGNLLEGTRFFGGGVRCHSLLLHRGETRFARFVDTTHMEQESATFRK